MFVLDAILDEGADTLVDLLLHCRRLTTNSSSSWRRDRQWQWQWRSFFGLKPSPLIVLCFRVYVVTPIRSFPSFELFTSRISLSLSSLYICMYVHIGYIIFTNQRSPLPIFREVFTPSRPMPSYLHIMTRNTWTLSRHFYFLTIWESDRKLHAS